MADHSVDLLVIGAGASGATVAFEAVRRGLSVALLEAGDIGGGTSCRSTKLLHGGVRYLELAFKTLDIAQLQLVREALLERAHWLEQAPFLARRLDLVLPTDSLWGQAYYRAGLGIYDALAGRRGIGRSHGVSQQQLQEAMPLLKPCRGGVAYSDGQFDDARLNLLLARSAEQGGASLRTRCRVVAFERTADGSLCAAISENSAGRQERWNASVIVNATGIQADSIRQMADPDAVPRMLTSRGSHLVLEQDLCPGGLGLLVPSTADGRVLFMLPFMGRTLVGTTDAPCAIEAATSPTDDEEAYLLSYVRQWFPKLTHPTVSSRWAGGRPLLRPAGDSLDSSRVVREHEVEAMPCGLISLMGGKWTTCRPMALDTLKAVAHRCGRSLPVTRSLTLLGSRGSADQTRQALSDQAIQLEALLPHGAHLQRQIMHLQGSHGLQALDLVQRADPDSREPLSPAIPLCIAEIDHAIQHEHAKSATDVLARRCRLAMVDLAEAQRLQDLVEQRLDQTGVEAVSTSPISHQLMP